MEGDIQMKIRTDEDIRAFQKALDLCKRAVLLLAPNGDQFDLKTARGQIEGISYLLNDRYEQAELFTSCYEDEMVMFGFLAQQLRCA